MIKIGDLICNEEPRTGSKCQLVVDEQMPVHEVLVQMKDHDSDFVGVNREGSTDEPVILSKEDLFEGLLRQFDVAQEKVSDLSRIVEGNISEQFDFVQESVRLLAECEKNKLEVAIANISEGLIIIDRHGEVEKSNPSANKLLGLKFDADNEDVMLALNEVGVGQLVGGRNESKKFGEFKVKAANDRILHMRWTEMLDEKNHLLGYVVMIRDVTDEMAAERAKTEFTAAISHELRTPLTSIQNSVSNILVGVTGKISRKTREYLHAMKSDCHRFAGLINDLLDIAKLESGNMPISRKGMNIVSVVSKVMDFFAKEAAAKDVELICEIKGHISPVFADPSRVSQVLKKLISNAINFTDPGGKIKIYSFDSGDDVVTVVEDTGRGISPDMQRQIFNKFYQIRRQSGPGYNGSGLGLSICEGVIAAHGGSIWVESEEQKGSKFYFSLPKTDPFIVLYKHQGILAKKARHMVDEFAMFIVNIDVPSDQRDQLKPKVSSLINKILTESDQIMTESDDLAIKTEDFEIVFVVSGTRKGHIESAKVEIPKIIRNCFGKDCGDHPIMPMLGMAVYPGDTYEFESLEKIARSNSKSVL